MKEAHTEFDFQGKFKPSEKYISVPEFCKKFDPELDPQNIYRKCREGELPSVKIGQLRYIALRELEASTKGLESVK